jgi:hypothetical protein
VPSSVLFLHPWAGGYGADRQLAIMVQGLDRSRVSPVVVLGEDGPLAVRLSEAGVPVYVRPMAVLRRELVRGRRAGATAAALARDARVVGALARRHGVSVVHTNTSTLLCGQAVARAARAAHVVHVREIYEGAGPGVLWPLLRRRLLRADALVCVSRAAASQFGGAPQAFVLHDAVESVAAPADRSEARAALALDEDAFVVALVGRLSDWKGQHVLLRALAAPPLRLVPVVALLAGDAAPGQEEHRADLVALAASLGVASRVRMLGFRDDLGTVLGAADAVAIPSVHPDAFPNVALTAAAAGLPTVASRCGGLPEIVDDGRTGHLVPPGDPAALAGALARLATDPAAARRLGETAASRATSQFSEEKLLERLHATYDEVVSGRRRAA